MVLDRDRLAVEGERGECRVALEQVKKLRDHRHEARAIPLEALFPLAVPVGVRDDEDAPAHSAADERDGARRGETRERADDRAGEDIRRVVHADGDPFDEHRQREEIRRPPPARCDRAESDGRTGRERRVTRGE